MPESLVEELKAIAEKNHYMDISEEIRGLLRERWLKDQDPFSGELSRIRKQAAEISTGEKLDALKSDLKKLLEGLDGL